MRSCCTALGTISSHLWWSMIMWQKRMYTCMCNWVTLLYNRKLTEHCKTAIMEKIKIIIKFKKRIRSLTGLSPKTLGPPSEHQKIYIQPSINSVLMSGMVWLPWIYLIYLFIFSFSLDQWFANFNLSQNDM